MIVDEAIWEPATASWSWPVPPVARAPVCIQPGILYPLTTTELPGRWAIVAKPLEGPADALLTPRTLLGVGAVPVGHGRNSMGQIMNGIAPRPWGFLWAGEVTGPPRRRSQVLWPGLGQPPAFLSGEPLR